MGKGTPGAAKICLISAKVMPQVTCLTYRVPSPPRVAPSSATQMTAQRRIWFDSLKILSTTPGELSTHGRASAFLCGSSHWPPFTRSLDISKITGHSLLHRMREPDFSCSRYSPSIGNKSLSCPLPLFWATSIWCFASRLQGARIGSAMLDTHRSLRSGPPPPHRTGIVR